LTLKFWGIAPVVRGFLKEIFPNSEPSQSEPAPSFLKFWLDVALTKVSVAVDRLAPLKNVFGGVFGLHSLTSRFESVFRLKPVKNPFEACSIYGHRFVNAGEWKDGREPSESGGRFPPLGSLKINSNSPIPTTPF
jgi:hypothetical protein